YNTPWSGLTESHLRGKLPLGAVKESLSRIVHGKKIVGAAIRNDLKALQMDHPAVVDIQDFEMFRRPKPNDTPINLAELWSTHFRNKKPIQQSSHSPIVDARAAMALFKLSQGITTDINAEIDDLAEAIEKQHLNVEDNVKSMATDMW
ncbi:apoptosis-enhancing nuclease-like protein, partial [Leptotrombidium deliense]